MTGWGAAQQLDDPSTDSLAAEVAMDRDGNALAVWNTRYTPTEGWGPSERIDQATYVVQTPDLAVSASGKAAAVWAQRSDGSSGQRIWANQYE